jgi:hypothetical protein
VETHLRAFAKGLKALEFDSLQPQQADRILQVVGSTRDESRAGGGDFMVNREGGKVKHIRYLAKGLPVRGYNI